MKSDGLFDRELNALIDQSISILQTRYSLDVNKIELTQLKRYKSLYLAMKDQRKQFQEDFKDLYEDKKNLILKSLEQDSWLKKGNIVIQYGEKVPELTEKCKNIRICLSFIYKSAVELQESTQKTIGELNTAITSQQQDLIRPSILLLHLLRVFYSVVDSDEKQALTGPIETLETDLQVKNKIIIKSGHSSSGLDINEGFKSVYTGVANLLRDAGEEVPEDIEIPNWDQFGQIVAGFINDPNVNNLLQNVGTALGNQGGSGNMMDNLKNLAANCLNQDSMKNLQQTVLTTAQRVKEQLSEKDKL